MYYISHMGTNILSRLTGSPIQYSICCLAVLLLALLLPVQAWSQIHADFSCEDEAEIWENQGVYLFARCGSPIPDRAAARACEFSTYGGVAYLPGEPTIHSIKGGDFVALCVVQEHYWFDVFLDTHSPGRMVIEIQKDDIDLRQFDFPHCLSPGNVWVRDDLNVLTESVAIRQIHETEHSRVLLISWDYSGVRMISYGGDINAYKLGIGGPDPRQCVEEYVRGGHDPSESIRHDSFDANSVKYVCRNYQEYTVVDFARNITTGSAERMCIGEKRMDFVLNVEEDGYLLLDIPHNVTGVSGFWAHTDGNYKSFYSGKRGHQGDPAAGRYSTQTLADQYGLFPINQLDIVFHSHDSDSTTYRVPFLKDDVIYRMYLGYNSAEYGTPKHVREKYAVPFTPAPPLVQSQLVPPKDVLCRDDLVLAFKPGTVSCDGSRSQASYDPCIDLKNLNYTAVCVKPSSLETLVGRGILHAEVPSS